MMQEPQQTEEEKSLNVFTSRAYRRPKTGSYEQLLCQHLMTSVSTFSLEKIRLICEAAYMVPDSPVDMEILEAVYQVVMSFRHTEVNINNPDFFPGTIAWGFDCNKANFKKYIEPWCGNMRRLYINTNRSEREIEVRKETKAIQEVINAAPDGEGPWHKIFWLYTTSGVFHLSGVEQLKARFVNWAMPECMRMFEQLTKLVNPRIYMDLVERGRT